MDFQQPPPIHFATESVNFATLRIYINIVEVTVDKRVRPRTARAMRHITKGLEIFVGIARRKAVDNTIRRRNRRAAIQLVNKLMVR